MPPSDTDWSQILLSPDWLAKLDRMAARRFVQPALAEEAVNEALDKLSHDNWAKLSSYSGKSAPETFALSVAGRVFEDFSRSRFGRPRPPAWLQREGNLWVQLWRMLCLERQWPDAITLRLKEDHSADLLTNIMKTIKQRIPRCGEPGFSECTVSELGLDRDPETSAPCINHELQQENTDACMELLGELLNSREGASESDDCPSNPLDQDNFMQFQESLGLQPEDRLILALTYEDGLSSRAVGEITGTNASQVQRQLKRIQSELANALLERGVDVGVLNIDTLFAGSVEVGF